MIGIEQTIDLIRRKKRTFVFSYSYDCKRYSQQPKDRDSTTTEGKKRAPSASTFLKFCMTSWFWICVACLSRIGCLGGGARGGWRQEVSQTCCWSKGQEEKSGCKYITPTSLIIHPDFKESLSTFVESVQFSLNLGCWHMLWIGYRGRWLLVWCGAQQNQPCLQPCPSYWR